MIFDVRVFGWPAADSRPDDANCVRTATVGTPQRENIVSNLDKCVKKSPECVSKRNDTTAYWAC